MKAELKILNAGSGKFVVTLSRKICNYFKILKQEINTYIAHKVTLTHSTFSIYLLRIIVSL